MTAMLAPGRDDVHQQYLDGGFDRLSDAQLVAEVGAALTPPRQGPADSFVLHAPLELLARAALLPLVRPDRRLEARLRLLALAEGYDRSGPAVPVARPDEFASPEDAVAILLRAVERGELDAVDSAASWLGCSVSPWELRSLLAEPIGPLLGAAAHAPIFLYQLPRVAPRGEGYGQLLRGLARELARNGTWRLEWIDGRRPARAASPDELFAALASTPRLGVPGSTFIQPLMAQVDKAIAANLIGTVAGGSEPELSREVLRAAAWSMLLEPPEHAPYGWSHCLTMPQAVLGTGPAFVDPADALAIAATYVVGFRAALAQSPLVPVAPVDPRLPVAEALLAGPIAAAGAVWHAPSQADSDIVAELASAAATAHDAHLVKYTLACFDAAADDRAHRRLFLAAAAALAAWWMQAGDPDDPFG